MRTSGYWQTSTEIAGRNINIGVAVGGGEIEVECNGIKFGGDCETLGDVLGAVVAAVKRAMQ